MQVINGRGCIWVRDKAAFENEQHQFENEQHQFKNVHIVKIFKGCNHTSVEILETVTAICIEMKLAKTN